MTCRSLEGCHAGVCGNCLISGEGYARCEFIPSIYRLERPRKKMVTNLYRLRRTNMSARLNPYLTLVCIVLYISYPIDTKCTVGGKKKKMVKTERKIKRSYREETSLGVKKGIRCSSVVVHKHSSVLVTLKFGVSRIQLHVKIEWYWRMKKVPILLRKNNRYTGISVS